MSASVLSPETPGFPIGAVRAAWRLCLAMPRLFGSLSVLLLLCELVPELLGLPDSLTQLPGETRLDMVFRDTLTSLAGLTIIQAAWTIAVRALLVGDTADRWVWQVPPTFKQLLLWSLITPAVDAVFSLAVGPVPVSDTPRVWVVTLWVIVVWLAQVPIFQLYPALAVGEAEGGVRQAWRDGRGRWDRYAGASFVAAIRIILIAMLAYAAVAIAAAALAHFVPMPGQILPSKDIAAMAASVVEHVAGVLFTTQIAARFFREARGDSRS